jgi:hypothetical protein
MPDVAELLSAGAQLSALGLSYIPLTSAPYSPECVEVDFSH